MYKRQHHNDILNVLRSFDGEKLKEYDCYFCGGTAIALLLNEYRTSVDIDFICSTQDGYREIRNTISQNNLGLLLKHDLNYAREIRADRDGIRTAIETPNKPIKLEIIKESRIQISGSIDPNLNVPVLSIEDLFAEKLLANDDRGSDKSILSRDLIDLSFMISSWGLIPQNALVKTNNAYGDSVIRKYEKNLELINNTKYLRSCFEQMDIDMQLLNQTQQILNASLLDIKNRWPTLHVAGSSYKI